MPSATLIHHAIIIGFLTSIFVTIFIILLDFMPLGKAPYLLVLNLSEVDSEQKILDSLPHYVSVSSVNSRNFSSNGLDLIIEVRTKKESQLMSHLTKDEAITNAALVAHNGEKKF